MRVSSDSSGNNNNIINSRSRNSGSSSNNRKKQHKNQNVVLFSSFRQDEFICTYGWVIGGGTCSGDVGGPGVTGAVDPETGRATGPVFGVAAFDGGSADCVRSPSCYTSLVYHRQWIRENTGI